MPTMLCCCDGCLIADDSFNRDASDLGSAWTHPPGDWITVATGPVANGYAEAQVDGARALHNTPHPLPSTSAHVYIAIVDEVVDSGDIYRVILNAVDDDNYHYAEFVRNGEDDSVIRLGKRTSGTDSILKTQLVISLEVTLDLRYFTAKIADDEFCAELGTAETNLVYLDGETPIPLGYYAGMGADDGCRIAEWSFLQHAQTNKECASCICKCKKKYIPPAINCHVHAEVWPRIPGPIEDNYYEYGYDYDCDLTLYWSPTGMWWDAFGRCVVGDQDLAWYIRILCPFDSPETNQLAGAYLSDSAGAPGY